MKKTSAGRRQRLFLRPETDLSFLRLRRRHQLQTEARSRRSNRSSRLTDATPRTKVRMIWIFTCTALLLRSALESMATLRLVKAYGRWRRVLQEPYRRMRL